MSNWLTGGAFSEAGGNGIAEWNPITDPNRVQSGVAGATYILLETLPVTIDDVKCEGITGITSRDIQVAHDIAHVIKLLAIAEKTDTDAISVRVHPTLVPRHHPLAAVRNAFNAIFVEAESAGDLMFYGRGAGGAPTASAILGDLIAVARNKVRGGIGVGAAGPCCGWRRAVERLQHDLHAHVPAFHARHHERPRPRLLRTRRQ